MVSVEEFCSLGVNVFPLLPGRKEPAIDWQSEFKLQKNFASEEQVKEWFATPDCNCGVQMNIAGVCGNVSHGFYVLDFERYDDYLAFYPEDGRRKLESSTIVVKTAHGGVHVYLRSTNCPKRHTKLFGNKSHQVDLCGEGGYVCLPPTVIEHRFCPKRKCDREGEDRYEIISPCKNQIFEWRVDDPLEAILKRGRGLGWTPRQNLLDELSQGSVGRFNSLSSNELFEKVLETDPKLNDCYLGSWQKHMTAKSRSAAEFFVVAKLVEAGFSDSEIQASMQESGIGKWNEKEASYQSLTIKKARRAQIRKFLARRPKTTPIRVENKVYGER